MKNTSYYDQNAEALIAGYDAVEAATPCGAAPFSHYHHLLPVPAGGRRYKRVPNLSSCNCSNALAPMRLFSTASSTAMVESAALPMPLPRGPNLTIFARPSFGSVSRLTRPSCSTSSSVC